MNNWIEAGENARLVTEIRSRISGGDSAVFIFLGAGLSFGVGRGRVLFEHKHHDDEGRFPSWPLLVQRMERRIKNLPEFEDYGTWVSKFFEDQNPIDCAELFRENVGLANYFDFLRDQFATFPSDMEKLTASHRELVQLPVNTIFTTNYDELIELAFQRDGLPVRVSSTPQEHMSHQLDSSRTHLVKLNGTINRPDTTILCRMDFAKARKERVEMLAQLSQDLKSSTFVFVGFSLSDPNFNLIHDEARLVTGDNMPVRYVVQGHHDPVKSAYLRSMGVNTINLGWWEFLPQFLRAINPAQ